MSPLPPEIDTPDLSDAERKGLLVAHEYFVATGDAEWWIDQEDES